VAAERSASLSRSRPLWQTLAPWLATPPVLLYLAMGQDHFIPWGMFAVDVVLCAAFGVACSLLVSFPSARSPLWPAVLLVVSALMETSAGGLVATVVHLAGVVATVLVPAWWASRRVQLPWWVGVVAVPPAALFLHLSYCYGQESLGPAEAVDALVTDLSWPARVEALAPPQSVGPSVVVISIDTLRADHAASMASVRRLADGGASWSSAMATSSWTLPSMASLHTGLVPGDHGAGCLPGFSCQGIRDDVGTVAEDFSELGYQTVGVSSNTWAGRGNGFARGFQRFADLGSVPTRRFLFSPAFRGEAMQAGSVVVDHALSVMQAVEGSFFLWVHLVEPHLPYLHSDDPVMQDLLAAQLRDASTMSEAFRDQVRAAYAHEVEVVDAEVMRLLDGLQAAGQLDDTLVILTSDHGEEFWEHGSVEHGHSHHAEVVEVPLVMRGPGVVPGRRTHAASLADVASTLRHTVGVDSDGVDLRQPQSPGRVVVAEGSLHQRPVCSARDETTRVIVAACDSTTRRHVRGYDLQADPAELWPLRIDPLHPVRQEAEAVQMPEAHDAGGQSKAGLRALGYVQ